MTRWKTLFSRRWLGYLAFAVAFAIACGFLSSWQLNRGNEAAAANRLIEANFHAPPVPLDRGAAHAGLVRRRPAVAPRHGDGHLPGRR